MAGRFGPRLQEIVEAYHTADLFQGAVLVAMGDEIVYRGAVGLANEEWGVANAPETRFTVASLGKAFTGVIVLQLIEEGRLSLADPLSEHLPELEGDAWRRVTIEHLVHHTAGIPWPQDDWEPSRYAGRYELAEIVTWISAREPSADPGAEFEYCNSCYHLLGAIIERITGSAFEDVLRERLLHPLELSNTGIAYARPLIQHRASGYVRDEAGSYVNALLQDQSYAVGAGGMYSTVDDLLRWHRALTGDQVLSAESKAMVFDRDRNRSGYGWSLGAYVHKDEEELGTLALGLGGTSGFSAGIARLLDDDYFIVFLGNIGHVPQVQLMNDLWNTILGFEVELPQ
ncbi:MAG: serine hydrolase domain-containing protein [Gemmatimonadota bacterium]